MTPLERSAAAPVETAGDLEAGRQNPADSLLEHPLDDKTLSARPPLHLELERGLADAEGLLLSVRQAVDDFWYALEQACTKRSERAQPRGESRRQGRLAAYRLLQMVSAAEREIELARALLARAVDASKGLLPALLCLALLLTVQACSGPEPCPLPQGREAEPSADGGLPEPLPDPAPNPDPSGGYPLPDGSGKEFGYRRDLHTGQVCTCTKYDPSGACVESPDDVPTAEAVSGGGASCKSGGICGGDCAPWSSDATFATVEDARTACEAADAAEGGNHYACDACSINGGEPESRHICGKVYWCCAQMYCHKPDGTLLTGGDWADIPICPVQYNKADSRHAAWEVWSLTYLNHQLDQATMAHKGTGAMCHYTSRNCHTDAIGNPDRCAIYPSAPAGEK